MHRDAREACHELGRHGFQALLYLTELFDVLDQRLDNPVGVIVRHGFVGHHPEKNDLLEVPEYLSKVKTELEVIKTIWLNSPQDSLVSVE